MPEITVRIRWDYPGDSFGLSTYSIADALHAYCGVVFVVTDCCGAVAPVWTAADAKSPTDDSGQEYAKKILTDERNGSTT